MDRTLKVYTKTDHLFAEFTFYYDHPQQVTARYIRYHRLYDDDEEDEGKSVFPGGETDAYLQYREFTSIEQIKAHDMEVVKKQMGRDMTDPATSYRYVYDPQPVLLRYVATNHIGCIGMIDVRFSFIENTKEVKFLSATHPRFDTEMSSNSMETNVSCITRMDVFTDRDIVRINSHDLKRLPP